MGNFRKHPPCGQCEPRVADMERHERKGEISIQNEQEQLY